MMDTMLFTPIKCSSYPPNNLGVLE